MIYLVRVYNIYQSNPIIYQSDLITFKNYFPIFVKSLFPTHTLSSTTTRCIRFRTKCI
eukprot:UN02403